MSSEQNNFRLHDVTDRTSPPSSQSRPLDTAQYASGSGRPFVQGSMARLTRLSEQVMGGQGSRDYVQRGEPNAEPRNRSVQIMTFSDMVDHAVDRTSGTDLANTISPRDFEDNPDLRIHLYMLTRFNISSVERFSDNLINGVQDSNRLSDIVKTHILNFVQSINKIKDYGEYKGSITCVDACRAIADTQNAANALYDMVGEKAPPRIKTMREVLNQIKSQYNW